MFLNILCILSFVIFPKSVILHLEKIPDGITHTAISFKTPYKTVRYDFRAFNENCTCMTTGLDRNNPRDIFPNIYNDGFNKKTRKSLEDFFIQKPKIINYEIILGNTYKSFDEIENFSNEINKKYIFCIYDCRHYTDNFAVWAGVGHIPIWRLSKYFTEENKVDKNN